MVQLKTKPQEQLASALDILLGTLEQQARQDGQLRQALATLGQNLLDFACPSAEPEPIRLEMPQKNQESAGDEDSATPVVVSNQEILDLIENFGKGKSLSTAPVAVETWHARPDPQELGVVQARLQLKAESIHCRTEDLPDPATLHRLQAQATELGCELWFLQVQGVPSKELGGCYAAAAEIAQLLQKMLQAEEHPKELREALRLAAEAQSALRASLMLIQANWVDPDQVALFSFVSGITRYEQIYLDRHMRRNDLADPVQHRYLRGKIQNLRGRWTSRTEHPTLIAREKRRVLYHAQRLESRSSLEPSHDWKIIQEGITSLLQWGLSLPDADLIKALQPLLAQVPEAALEMVGLILGAQSSETSEESEQPCETPDELQQKAAQLLEGKTLTLIGGDPRPAVIQRIVSAFGLRGLDWVESSSHQSFYDFEPQVASADLVCLAIRWASHSFMNVKKLCEAHGKTFVVLPAGYGVNQIAHQVLQQAKQHHPFWNKAER